MKSHAKGATKEDRATQGQWKQDSQDGAYGYIPFTSVRTLAGFGPERGRYYVVREHCLPDIELQQQIFPWLEQSSNELAETISSGEVNSEIAGTSFLSLIAYLRKVILQDAALLLTNPEYKDHPILNLPVFQNEMFLEFAQSIRRVVSEAPQTPELRMISDIAPVLGILFVYIR